MMVPVGRLVVLRSAGRDQLVTAIAILTWPALAAPIIAPFVGGVLVDTLSWHWIFLINIPLGVVAFVAALVLVPQERAPSGCRSTGSGPCSRASGSERSS